MIVEVNEGKQKIFCDEGVYSKNRNFRMYLSTKYGKKAPLVLSAHNQYRPSIKVESKDIDEIIFYDSLVTYYR
ncbi:Coiled-coil domain-containing protein 111-like protein, partial [Stegodyphus mimosarum]